MKYVTSKRGNKKLVFESHRYVRDRQNRHGIISWRCDKKPCKGRVKTYANNDYDISIIQPHNCSRMIMF